MILQSILAMLVYVFILIILGLTGAVSGLPISIATPILISTATIFLYGGSFLPMPAAIILPASIGLTIALFVILKFRLKLSIRVPSLPKKYVLAIVLMSMFLLIPRMNFLTLPISREIRFPYIGDETKHIAVLTSIASSRSFPPRFPYDPTLPFPYYYFFYLIPGTVLRLFPHANPGIIWFVHVFLSQIMAFGVFVIGIFSLTNKRLLRALGIGLVFFGSSFKIIPKLFHFWGITEPHIEHWWQIPSDALFGKPGLIGWQITHPVTLAVWTPQHQWAAMLCVIICILLLQKKITIPFFIVAAILLTTLIGTSAFVAASFLIVLGVFVLASQRSIHGFISWGVTFAVPLLLALPLLKVFSSNQAGITLSPYLPHLPYLSDLLGVPIFYLIETGFAIPVILILLFLTKKLWKDRILLFLLLAVFVPLILSRLVTSQFMNDIGMRIPIVYTAFMPFLVIFLLDTVQMSKFAQRLVMILLTTSIVFGAFAGMLEIYFQSSKVETYPELISRLYQVTVRFTNPDDIIVINDAYLADRMPLFAARMTLKPEIPFSMDVYVPKRITGVSYPTAICPMYKNLRRKLPSSPVVYAELANVAPLTCKEIVDAKRNAAVLFSSPSVTLYRLR